MEDSKYESFFFNNAKVVYLRTMKKRFFIFILFSQSLVSFAQFTDTFSDGDFTNNPMWIGDAGNFEVDSLSKLHLNDSITNSSYLSTASQAIINGIWEFEVKMDCLVETALFRVKKDIPLSLVTFESYDLLDRYPLPLFKRA